METWITWVTLQRNSGKGEYIIVQYQHYGHLFIYPWRYLVWYMTCVPLDHLTPKTWVKTPRSLQMGYFEVLRGECRWSDVAVPAIIEISILINTPMAKFHASIQKCTPRSNIRSTNLNANILSFLHMLQSMTLCIQISSDLLTINKIIKEN